MAFNKNKNSPIMLAMAARADQGPKSKDKADALEPESAADRKGEKKEEKKK